MTGTIIIAVIALVAIGAFAIVNTAQKVQEEMKSKIYQQRRAQGYTGMPRIR